MNVTESGVVVVLRNGRLLFVASGKESAPSKLVPTCLSDGATSNMGSIDLQNWHTLGLLIAPRFPDHFYKVTHRCSKISLTIVAFEGIGERYLIVTVAAMMDGIAKCRC